MFASLELTDNLRPPHTASADGRREEVHFVDHREAAEEGFAVNSNSPDFSAVLKNSITFAIPKPVELLNDTTPAAPNSRTARL